MTIDIPPQTSHRNKRFITWYISPKTQYMFYHGYRNEVWVSCVDRNACMNQTSTAFFCFYQMRSHISVGDTFISPPIPVPPPPLLNVQNVVYCQSAVSEPCHCITELYFIYQIIRIPPLKKIWQNDCIIAHGLIFFLQQYKKCLSLNCGSNRYMYICNVSSTAKTGSFQS